MTNIVAMIVVAVSTNVYHPQQTKVMHYYPAHPVIIEERWVDGEGFGNMIPPETRDNPDVRITEVKRRRELVFAFEGKDYRILLDEAVISRKEERRAVKETWREAAGTQGDKK